MYWYLNFRAEVDALMKDLLKDLWRLRQSSFLRGVVAIAGGTALAQAFNFLLLPLVARLYSPEAMGLWGIFVSFLVVASVVTTLRYEVAVATAGSDEEALALTRSALILSVPMGLLGGGALELMRRADLLGYGALPPEASFLGFAALTATAWGTVLRYYAVRQGMFGLVGRLSVVQGIARSASQILLSIIGGTGLLWGEALGRFLGLAALWRNLLRLPGPYWRSDVLLKFRAFPLIQVPSGLLNTAALMAPVPIFVMLYGPAVGGALALAQRAVGVPVSLVGGAVADVFYSRAVELLRVEPHMVRPLFLRTSGRVFLLALFLGLLLGLGAPFVVLLFGERWELAGDMMRIMAPWMMGQLVVSSVGRVVFLSRFPWIKLFYDALSAIAISAIFWFRLPPKEALMLLTWFYVGLYFLYWLVIWRLTHKQNLCVIMPLDRAGLVDVRGE